MQIRNNTLTLSATDLANHLACRHLTNLELEDKHGFADKPIRRDHRVERLVQLGEDHERAYIEHLKAKGLNVLDWVEDDSKARPTLERTRDAMIQGVDVIVQARLENGRWGGYADVLLKVNRPSSLGDWSYEVVDTKLTSNTKGGTILQLCLYSEIVGEIQGAADDPSFCPEQMHVVSPSADYTPEDFRVDDYNAYYRFVKRRLEEAVAGYVEVAADTSARFALLSETYPVPVPHCDVCTWWSMCRKRREDDDHLSLVASCSGLHRRELEEQGYPTLEQLALLADDPNLEIPFSPKRGSKRTYASLQRQARLQYEQRETKQPRWEYIEQSAEDEARAASNTGFHVEKIAGLARLPEPDPGDVFFDIEGDRFVGDAGLEYLFGYAVHPDGGGSDSKYEYRSMWAFEEGSDEIHEKRMFEQFIDMIVKRRQQFPGMHIYHYNHYEPTNIKRLMTVHATCEEEVDELLRAGVFVDLYAVVRQGIRAGVESYSIKRLEQYYGFEREIKLEDEARPMLNKLEGALEKGLTARIDSEVRMAVEGYNKDDCLSTAHLRDWLEELRRIRIEQGVSIDRPPLRPGDPNDNVEQKQEATRRAVERLVAHLPEERSEWTRLDRAVWLLSVLLEWHRREAKVTTWEYHRLKDLTEDELFEERAAIGGLEFVRVVDADARLYEYTYPKQETKVREGKSLKPCDMVWPDDDDTGSASTDNAEDARRKNLPTIADVERIDTINRTIVLKKPKKFVDFHPAAVFQDDSFYANVQADAILRFGQAVGDVLGDVLGDVPGATLSVVRDTSSANDNAPSAPGTSGTPTVELRSTIDASEDVIRRIDAVLPATWRPAWRLLCRRFPTDLLRESRAMDSTLDRALFIATRLDGDALAIQGPPGSGKTYTGARMICDLVKAGKKVGVCAISHKVVRNLLDEVIDVSDALGQDFLCVQKPSKPVKKAEQHPRIMEVGTNPLVEQALGAGGAMVFGGTTYLWSRPEFADAVDVLIVDEAGQMSLANVLAISQAGGSLVLLGDPAQLDQPQKAAHPEGSDKSALEYVLADAEVIDDDAGLFISETRRLHPSITELTSELFYRGKLRSLAGLERQAISGSDLIPECGLYFMPVDHEGNRNESIEEVAEVRRLVDSLVGADGGVPATWTDADGIVRPMTLDDILIVAPYNAHVTLLQSALPDARVGTVDKFQGQEAPVVIYALGTSSPEEAPRGMEFLYSLNRLNVATSRAKCAVVLVCSPRLLEPECRKPSQMKLANALARYVEMSAVLESERI